MEQFLRLLNPKTTNFDGVAGTGHGALTAADVCIAMSYAKLTPLQDNLFRLKCLGANTVENIETFAGVLLIKLNDSFQKAGLDIGYRLAVIKTALIEFCMVAADYKASNRNRAIFSGVSYETVRKVLSKHINEIKDFFITQYEIAEQKISKQIKKDTL